MEHNPEKYHEKIDAYLRNELSDEERLIFEKELSFNEELNEEFKIHQELFTQVDENPWMILNTFKNDDIKEIQDHFKSEEVAQLKNTIKKVSNSYAIKEKRKPFLYRKLMPALIAASILLFLFIKIYSTPVSHIDLYEKYNDLNDLPSLTSRGNANQFSEGERLFRAKEYDLSYAFFNAVSNEQRPPGVLIYLGLSALELNDFDQAVVHFKELKKMNVLDSSKSYWYLSLTYLKSGDTHKTKETLKELINGQHYKTIEAKKLLNDL